MNEGVNEEANEAATAEPRPGAVVTALVVLWPAFVAAGVLDTLLFSLVDPLELRWFGEAVTLGRPAAYTLAFVLFWALAAAASATSLWLRESRKPSGAWTWR